MVYYTIDDIVYNTLGFEAGENILKSNAIRMKNFSMLSQFRAHIKKKKFNEDLLKRVNPDFSDKLGSVNYFIRMYSKTSSNLIRDLKAILCIIMNIVKYLHVMV